MRTGLAVNVEFTNLDAILAISGCDLTLSNMKKLDTSALMKPEDAYVSLPMDVGFGPDKVPVFFVKEVPDPVPLYSRTCPVVLFLVHVMNE
jgi:hypothetical protein